jgi:hypothetical protein
MAFSVVVIVQIADNLPEVVFAVFLMYAASGYVMWVSKFAKRKEKPLAPPRKEPGEG